MRPGRKPVPTGLRKLRGNPGKRAFPKNEANYKADTTLLEPSGWLLKDAEAAAEWRRLAPDLLQAGVLKNTDRVMFEAYCRVYSQWRRLQNSLDNPKVGLVTKSGRNYRQQSAEATLANKLLEKMSSIAAEFGFTPSSRTRVTGGEEAVPDAYTSFIKTRPARRVGASAAKVATA